MRPERLARVRAARYHRHGHPHHHCLILMAMVCLWDQGRRGARAQARRGPRTRARSSSLARHRAPARVSPAPATNARAPFKPAPLGAKRQNCAWIAGPGAPGLPVRHCTAIPQGPRRRRSAAVGTDRRCTPAARVRLRWPRSHVPNKSEPKTRSRGPLVLGVDCSARLARMTATKAESSKRA